MEIELKRTDKFTLRALTQVAQDGLAPWHIATAVKQRLLAAKLIRYKPGTAKCRVIITKAGRDAHLAAMKKGGAA